MSRRRSAPAGGAARATRRAASFEAPTQHAVYRLAADLLLVFKPRGHREAEHAHPHRQRLRILRGRLRVDSGRTALILTPRDAPYTLAAGRRHATHALSDTWLVAEAIVARKRPTATSC